MKANKKIRLVLFWVLSSTALLEVYAAGIEGFTALDAIGDCRIRVGATYQDVVVGTRYDFGTMVKTGRNSYLDLQFSESNSFRLLARTQLVITEGVRNPNLKILQLSKGSVNLQLDNFPVDHKLHVETPSAICGAVGTRFVVSFEDDAVIAPVSASPGSRVHRFSCEQGELQVASRFTIDDEIVIGQSFAVDSVTAGSDMVAVIQEGLDNVYTDVTVNRGRLTFKYGGEDGTEFVVDAGEGETPSRFQAALSKKEDGSVFVAFKMIDGFADFIFFGGEGNVARIASGDGAVLVPKAGATGNIVKSSQASQAAQQQLNASNAEGKEFAKLVDLKKTGASDAAIKDQRNRVAKAAQATNIVKNSSSSNFGGEPAAPDPSQPSEKPQPPDVPGAPPGSGPRDGSEDGGANPGDTPTIIDDDPRSIDDRPTHMD